MGPLTVLIGPNDSGKTSFLTAFRKLRDGNAIELKDCWRGERINAQIAVADDADHTMRISKGGDVSWSDEAVVALVRSLQSFALPSQGVDLASRGVSDLGGVPYLDANGRGVPTLLDYLLRRHRTRFDRFVDDMRQRVPGLEEIDISTPEAADRGIQLVCEGGYRVVADNVSTGVRLLLFFLALRYHPNPPGIILVEEPENGVHRQRLGDIVSLLRDMTQPDREGRAVQVILSTHSPHLLDHVDLEQDQVLVFRRQDDGSRSVEPAEASSVKAFLDEFMLGEVWFNEGEDGLVARG